MFATLIQYNTKSFSQRNQEREGNKKGYIQKHTSQAILIKHSMILYREDQNFYPKFLTITNFIKVAEYRIKTYIKSIVFLYINNEPIQKEIGKPYHLQ